MSEFFMRRALELAALGAGNVSPNPLVGCVIEHQGFIIGEGFHQKYGEAHAEVNAINAVKEPSKLSDATVYVTLEPCSHFGKTPPCADLLIKHQVKKVIVCNEDPFELVAGKGMAKLRAAGIEVEQGLLEEEGRWLNRRFFTFVEKKRPYIILKWAASADGFIAGENFEPIKISNELSHRYSHKFRTEEDAIMVGTNTAIYDNPQLNARLWKTKRQPTRILMDRQLRVNSKSKIVDNSCKTLVFNEIKSEVSNQNEFITIDFRANVLNAILQNLYERKIQSLIVEGGTQLLQSFLDNQLFDEIRIFKSPKVLGKGIAAPTLPLGLSPVSKQNLFDDELIILKRFQPFG